MNEKYAIRLIEGQMDEVHDFSWKTEAEKLAIEALKKRVPADVLPDTEYLEGICPSCGVHFLDRSTKFCGNCGQALKWRQNK